MAASNFTAAVSQARIAKTLDLLAERDYSLRELALIFHISEANMRAMTTFLRGAKPFNSERKIHIKKYTPRINNVISPIFRLGDGEDMVWQDALVPKKKAAVITKPTAIQDAHHYFFSASKQYLRDVDHPYYRAAA